MTAVDVVLPCLDEAQALPWVLGRMPGWAHPIVVDNGCTDGSDELARRLGATVVSAPERGYGAACHAGLLAASAPLVAFMDCDASLDPRQLSRLVAMIDDPRGQAGQGCLVVGRRMPLSGGAWPWHLRVANRVVAHRLNRRTGLRLRDVGPMRLARAADLLALGIDDRRSGYPLETVVRAAEAGWRVTQVEVDYLPRAGRSKVTGTPLGAARAVRDMTKVLAR
ncbi:MAG: glycosyltransferase family 2 protein [Humibacillus sp.]|nr:glycosyltransferase family 2 protein [Humibacillus sp.]MDN5778909.1 glycosyltransferase family 2 protein [Humibacillus sp.]